MNEKVKQIAEDLAAVLKEAKNMGCKEVKYFHNIPLENVEVVVKALEKQIPKKPKDIRYFGMAGHHIGLCPVCNDGANSEFQYCGDCGQRLDWSVEE